MLTEIYAGFNDVAKTTMEDDKKVTLKVVLPTKKVSWGFICGQVWGYNRSRSDCTCNMINLMRFGSSCMGLNIEIMGNI